MGKVLSPRQVSKKLGPRKFMALCEKVTTSADQKFDVLSITQTQDTATVEVELENGERRTVTI